MSSIKNKGLTSARWLAVELLLVVVASGCQSLAFAEEQPMSLPFIQVASDNWTFESVPGGERFIPFGSNFIFTKPGSPNDEHALDVLTAPEWNPELVLRAFEGARALNMNVLKVFLPIWQTLPDPQPRGQLTLGAMEPPLLERLDYVFSVANDTGVYVSLTLAEWGAHSLKWWQKGGTFLGRDEESATEFNTYDTYRRFWTLIATRYKDEPALFSYNLAVEFYLPGGNWGTAKDDSEAYNHVFADRWGLPAWRKFLRAKYGEAAKANHAWGTDYTALADVPQPSLAWGDNQYEAPQAMVVDYGEFREQVTVAFLCNQTEAIRAVDGRHMITCGFHPHHPAIGWSSSGKYLAGAAPAKLDMLDYTTTHVYTNNPDYSAGLDLRSWHMAVMATRFAYGGKPVIVEEMGHITLDRSETTRETIRLVTALAPHASGFMLWFLGDINTEKPYGPLTPDLEVNSFGAAWRKLAELGGAVAELPTARAPAVTTYIVDRLEGLAPAKPTCLQQVLDDWEGTPQPVDILLESKKSRACQFLPDLAISKAATPGGYRMRFLLMTWLLATLGLVLASCGEADYPVLEAKPYWIGVAPSHIAEPVATMLAPDAAWKSGLSHLSLYKYYGVQVPGVTWATPLPVPELVAFVKRNNLKLACEFGSFSPGPGHHLSDSAFAELERELDPVIAAGGTIYSIDLDGPVCRTVKGIIKTPGAMPLEAIASELARFFALARAKYPGLKIGLIPNLPNWDYTRELLGYNGHNTDMSGYTYLEALEAVSAALEANSDQIDFVEVDCPYNYYREKRTRNGDGPVDNAAKLKALQQWCQAHGAEFVLIVNAEHRGGGGKAFHELVLSYVRAIRRDGVFPDGFLLQSWYDKPDVNLPETAPYTFSNTVRDAARLINWTFPRSGG